MTLYPNPLIFFVAKMREAFAISHFFNKKYWQISDINVLNFNDTLTNDVVSFEQPGPELHIRMGIEDNFEIIFNWAIVLLLKI